MIIDDDDDDDDVNDGDGDDDDFNHIISNFKSICRKIDEKKTGRLG